MLSYRAVLGAGWTFLAAASFLGLSAANLSVETSEMQPTTAAAVEFNVDPTHSSVVFSIEHSGVSRFYGRFAKVSGTFTVNPGDGSLSALNVEIPAESIDTNNPGRDRHLKGTDFFDAKQFTTLSLVSTKVEHKAGSVWTVTGDFSLHGVTKSTTVDVEVTGHKQGQKGYLAGIASEFVITRSDFGMTHYVESGGLGDEVKIMVGLEGRGE